MTIELGLRTLLLAQYSIASLVPAQTVKGISYQGVFNENPTQGFVAPFILIVTGESDPLLSLGATTGTEKTNIDIDCYSPRYADAVAIAEAVKTYLKDYTGAAGSSDTIQAVELQERRVDSYPEDEGRDVRQYVISLNFDIYHY